jgi:hypothetical protein
MGEDSQTAARASVPSTNVSGFVTTGAGDEVAVPVEQERTSR